MRGLKYGSTVMLPAKGASAGRAADQIPGRAVGLARKRLGQGGRRKRIGSPQCNERQSEQCPAPLRCVALCLCDMKIPLTAQIFIGHPALRAAFVPTCSLAALPQNPKGMPVFSSLNGDSRRPPSIQSPIDRHACLHNCTAPNDCPTASAGALQTSARMNRWLIARLG